jgi:hypothetical protein
VSVEKRMSELSVGERFRTESGCVATVTKPPEREGQWLYRVETDGDTEYADYADYLEVVSDDAPKEPAILECCGGVLGHTESCGSLPERGDETR